MVRGSEKRIHAVGAIGLALVGAIPLTLVGALPLTRGQALIQSISTSDRQGHDDGSDENRQDDLKRKLHNGGADRQL